jgi:stress response protein SCP2
MVSATPLNLIKDIPLNLEKLVSIGSRVTIKSNWDVSDDKIDFDLYCFTTNIIGNKQLAYFNCKSIHNGAIKCREDNRTGGGDAEYIDIDFTKLPSEVIKLTINLSSYTGQTFDEVTGEYIQLLNDKEQVVAGTEGEITGQGKTLRFIEFVKENNIWILHTILKHDPRDFGQYVTQEKLWTA